MGDRGMRTRLATPRRDVAPRPACLKTLDDAPPYALPARNTSRGVACHMHGLRAGLIDGDDQGQKVRRSQSDESERPRDGRASRTKQS